MAQQGTGTKSGEKISRFFAEFFRNQAHARQEAAADHASGRGALPGELSGDRETGAAEAPVDRVPDETGWRRIGGRLAWMHVAVGQDAVAYRIGTRGIATSILIDRQGVCGQAGPHDGWSSYDQFYRALHQTCVTHLLRRCKEILQTATRGAVHFPRQVKGLPQEALAIRDQRDEKAITPAAACEQADILDARMDNLLHYIKTNAVNERFAKHLAKHRREIFTFLRHEGIDATNHQAEQAIRPAVVNRKVWGGNRTAAGAVAQAVLMTVLFTAYKNGRNALEFLSRQLRSPHALSPLPLPALTGRALKQLQFVFCPGNNVAIFFHVLASTVDPSSLI